MLTNLESISSTYLCVAFLRKWQKAEKPFHKTFLYEIWWSWCRKKLFDVWSCNLLATFCHSLLPKLMKLTPGGPNVAETLWIQQPQRSHQIDWLMAHTACPVVNANSVSVCHKNIDSLSRHNYSPVPTAMSTRLPCSCPLIVLLFCWIGFFQNNMGTTGSCNIFTLLSVFPCSCFPPMKTLIYLWP